MNILRTILGWFKGSRSVDSAALDHARRTLHCALCLEVLAPHEFARTYCDACWALRDDSEVRAFGEGTSR